MAQVELACKLADDDVFRPGMPRKMTVQLAKFEMRGPEYIPKKKQNKKMGSKERAKLSEKVLGWGGFDDKLKPSQVPLPPLSDQGKMETLLECPKARRGGEPKGVIVWVYKSNIIAFSEFIGIPVSVLYRCRVGLYIRHS